MKKTYILFFLLYALNGHAQKNKTISLNEAIKTGLENNKHLHLSQSKVNAANARYKQAIDATIPSLKVIAGYTRQSDVDEFKAQFPGKAEPITFYPNIPNNYTLRASLSETIFSGFRLKYAQESQQLLRQAVLFDAQKDSNELVFAVINAYYNLYKIIQTQSLIENNISQIKEHLADVLNWEKHGIATHNEVLKWQLQLSNTELSKLDAQNNFDIASYNFGLMLGAEENVSISDDSSSLFPSRELKPLQDFMESASINRGELKSLQAKRQSSQNLLHVAQNSYYPNVSMGANYYYLRPNPRNFPITDEFKQTWDVGITFTWDITNLYSNRHNIEEAQENAQQYELQEGILSDNIKMEVNQYYFGYTESLSKIEVLKKAIQLADENYRITDNKYKNQLVLQSELQDAENALLQSKLNYIIARADAETAYYKLLKATGAIQ